jgi:ABC-type multidrug transport system fused ATPase/permease subunit
VNRSVIIAISLALFAVLTGYLLSAISFVGRSGINLIYTEYKFLKSWWKAALLVYIVWLVVYFVQLYFSRKVSKASSNLINLAALSVAVAGLYFSYADFRNSLSHRMLGERFHLGVYLFWLGWITISVLLLINKKPETIESDQTLRL